MDEIRTHAHHLLAHRNLLYMLGFSTVPECQIVFEHMAHGSLFTLLHKAAPLRFTEEKEARVALDTILYIVRMEAGPLPRPVYMDGRIAGLSGESSDLPGLE